jgi:hypothetical protein
MPAVPDQDADSDTASQHSQPTRNSDDGILSIIGTLGGPTTAGDGSSSSENGDEPSNAGPSSLNVTSSNDTLGPTSSVDTLGTSESQEEYSTPKFHLSLRKTKADQSALVLIHNVMTMRGRALSHDSSVDQLESGNSVETASLESAPTSFQNYPLPQRRATLENILPFEISYGTDTDGNAVIRGITVPKWIELLTDPQTATMKSTQYWQFMEVLLLTYPTFISSKELLDSLITR